MSKQMFTVVSQKMINVIGILIRRYYVDAHYVGVCYSNLMFSETNVSSATITPCVTHHYTVLLCIIITSTRCCQIDTTFCASRSLFILVI